MRALAALLTVALLVSAACGGDGDAAAPTTTSRPTTTSTPPTTVPSGPAAPLTGEPVGDASGLQRPALVVKLDNAPKGRPQSGVNQADVVVVEKVEDGVTRLAAIFHSTDADPLGPVRSARSTDIALVAPLRQPLFAYAGANAAFQRLVDEAPLVDVGARRLRVYRRERGRPAPYNLFTSTGALYAHAPSGAQPPPPLFTYRPAGAPVAAAGAAPAEAIHVEYLGDNIDTIVDYHWDASRGGWARSQDGTPFVDAAGDRVVPANVIVQFVDYVDTGQRDTSNTVVPEAQLVGEGEAWVFTGGHVIPARWSKPALEAVTAFTDQAGQPVALTPGRTWIELPLPGMAGRR